MAGVRIRALTTPRLTSLLQPAADPHGSLTSADAPLIKAGILFRQPEPPLLRPSACLSAPRRRRSSLSHGPEPPSLLVDPRVPVPSRASSPAHGMAWAPRKVRR